MHSPSKEYNLKIPLQPDSMIALFLDKSELTIIAILSVWKASAAYVPIDPSAPDQRIQFILSDTNTKAIITNQQYIEQITEILQEKNLEIPIIIVETLAKENLPKQNSKRLNAANNLAYVIYTSGSTGEPKGVLIEHRTVINFAKDLPTRYFKNDGKYQEAILLLSNYVFDYSLEQISLSILSSNKLIILPKNVQFGSKDSIVYLNKNNLTYLSGTPSQMQLIDFTQLNTLKLLCTGGEEMKLTHYEHIRKGFNGIVMQIFGATETTIYNLAEPFLPGDAYRKSLGKPLTNNRVYVLDELLRPVPPGAIGELYISGNCLARGYLNRPEENSKRFILNLFLTEKENSKICDKRMYKTGDLVRLNYNEELEYIGRNDLQVIFHLD